MGKFTKVLLLTLLCAMLAGVACIGVAAETTDDLSAQSELVNPITYAGMSARTRLDYPGLRSLYTVDLEMVKAWEDAVYGD